jgi:hypothetical protein
MSIEIKRFDSFSKEELLVDDFIKFLNPIVTESDKTDVYSKFQKKIISDLKLDLSLITTFGTGLTSFYPIVEEMMKQTSFSADITKDTVVLLTITAISIIYLEEKKIKTGEEKLTKDTKSMLEELRMRGIGDGIVKKLIKILKSISKIFSIIGKHIGAVVGGFIDMFAYTTLMIPFLNAVFLIIGKYDLNLDTALQNLFAITIGVGTRISKNALVKLIDSLKGFISKKKKTEIIGELEEPLIKKFRDLKDTPEQSGKLITEQ